MGYENRSPHLFCNVARAFNTRAILTSHLQTFDLFTHLNRELQIFCTLPTARLFARIADQKYNLYVGAVIFQAIKAHFTATIIAQREGPIISARFANNDIASRTFPGCAIIRFTTNIATDLLWSKS